MLDRRNLKKHFELNGKRLCYITLKCLSVITLVLDRRLIIIRVPSADDIVLCVDISDALLYMQFELFLDGGRSPLAHLLFRDLAI